MGFEETPFYGIQFLAVAFPIVLCVLLTIVILVYVRMRDKAKRRGREVCHSARACFHRCQVRLVTCAGSVRERATTAVNRVRGVSAAKKAQSMYDIPMPEQKDLSRTALLEASLVVLLCTSLAAHQLAHHPQHVWAQGGYRRNSPSYAMCLAHAQTRCTRSCASERC